MGVDTRLRACVWYRSECRYVFCSLTFVDKLLTRRVNLWKSMSSILCFHFSAFYISQNRYIYITYCYHVKKQRVWRSPERKKKNCFLFLAFLLREAPLASFAPLARRPQRNGIELNAVIQSILNERQLALQPGAPRRCRSRRRRGPRALSGGADGLRSRVDARSLFPC